MRIGKKDRFKNRIDNVGYTLIELIVVISIMAIMTGTAALGLSVAFSKDAARCATLLDDALTETRMLSMSKEGDFSLSITVDANGHHKAIISGGTTTESEEGGSVYTETYNQEIDLEGDSGIKISSITCNSPSITLLGDSASSGNQIKIVFNKTKGNVHSVAINDGAADSLENSNEIMIFDITPVRGNRTAKVQLVTSTGKHTVGDF